MRFLHDWCSQLGYCVVAKVKNVRSKVELAVGRGKEIRDKRRDLAKRDAERQIERPLKGR